MIFFQVSWSCQSNLLSVLNILRDATEHNLEVDLAYLDFAKAFDSVRHRKLIHKLEKYGITLDERFPVEQNTTSTSALYDWASVIGGVCQGSAFGPILFALFINDLPRYILAKLFLFADDTKLLQVCKSCKMT